MPVRVVDASAAGALVFSQPGADRVVDGLAGASRVAPALLGFKLASIWLARHLGADLVTLDERVRRTAAAPARRQTP